MRKIFTTIATFAAIFVSLTLAGSAHAASAPAASIGHVATRLHSVNGSGVEGFVSLQQLKQGTHITLLGFGLKPGHNYVSLYYGNHRCNLEPYSANDVIGGIYTANIVGVGFTNGNADDNLDEINSVSIRDANDFHLLACADVHPM